MAEDIRWQQRFSATADAIAEQIVNGYLPCFKQRRQRLNQRIAEE
jgi:hypothetical protein